MTLYPSLSELLAQYITKLIYFPRLFWHLLHISFPEPIRNKQKNIVLRHFKLFFGGMTPLFLCIFIFYRTYIHSITFIQYIYPSPFAEVPLHLLSISSPLVSSVEKPPWGPEPTTELGHVLQQADAQRYQLSYAAPTNYAAPTGYAAPTLNGVKNLKFYCCCQHRLISFTCVKLFN